MNKNQFDYHFSIYPYLILGTLFLGLFLMIIFSYLKTKEVVSQNMALTECAYEFEVNITNAHLWFKECISGDISVKKETIFEYLNRAEYELNHLLTGGETRYGKILVVTDIALKKSILSNKEHLSHLKVLMKEVFSETLKANKLEVQEIHEVIDKMVLNIKRFHEEFSKYIILRINKFKQFQVVFMMLLILILFIISGLFFYFEKFKLNSFQKLKLINQNLDTLNQQLSANERQLSAANQQLTATNEELVASNENLIELNRKLEMDEKEIKKINLAHEKKVKELNCFYSIANLIYKQDITTDDFLSKVVSIIPTAWLYSSISGAKIKYKNKEYLSKDFRESVIKQSFEIKENEGDAVILEVYYLEKKSESDSDLFEKEFNLLEYIGKRISEILSSINSANTRRKLLETITLKNEELESIVYIASHDLRSPLVNIQGFRGELFNYMQEVMEIIDVNNLDEEKKERFHSIMETDIPTALNYIYTSANKMESLIRGLLKVSKLGSPELNPAQVDMNKLIKKILSSMQYLIRQKGVQVIVEDLPSCFADESQINQVFSNLCDNALKYLDKEKKSKIVISGTIGNNYSIYCVSDNGVGIPKEHQKKVFDIFYRLHTETAPGEGLGLTIVKRILDRNNGKITLESESGKGTDFYVYLPVSQLV